MLKWWSALSVRAEKAGNRIVLTRPDDRPIRGLNTHIPGANRRKDGSWTVPLRLDVCRLLRSHYGKRLRVGRRLAAWANEAVRTEQELGKLSGQMSALLHMLPSQYPKLAKAMHSRTYQQVGVKFIAEGRRVLIADDVGLGKTIQAMGGIVEAGQCGPYLVVCPKTATTVVWEPEIKRWLPDHNPITMPEGGAKRRQLLDGWLEYMRQHKEGSPLTYPDKTWIIINPAMLRVKSYWDCKRCSTRTPTSRSKKLKCGHPKKQAKTVHEPEYPQLFEVEWGAIIIDESDQCLIKQSIRNPTQTRRGADMLQSPEDGIRIAQSATPNRSRPYLLWGTLNWLRAKEHKGLWPWAETYFEVTENFMGAREIGRLRTDREQLLQQSLSGIMLRRERSEVAPELPDRIYMGTPLPDVEDQGGRERGIWLPMKGEQARAYKEMVKYGAAKVLNGHVNAVGSLAELTRLRQLASAYGTINARASFEVCGPSNKLEYLKELLEQMGFPHSPQTKLVVVSQYTSLLGYVSNELDLDHGMITGAVTGADRADAVKSFNSPKRNSPHIMFLNIDAGGSAITLDAADDMVFLDEVLPDQHEQAEGRIDNRRPEHKIVPRRYYYLRSLGTVDIGTMYTNLDMSAENLRALGGVEYAQHVLQSSPGHEANG